MTTTRLPGWPASCSGLAKSKKSAPPCPASYPCPVETSTPPARNKQEKVGKYRDPNFHHYGVYLRKDSHKRANRRLEDMESGKDFSELMQELLDQWLASSRLLDY